MGEPPRAFVLIDFKYMILFVAASVVPKVSFHVIILHLSPQAILPRVEFLFKRINNKLLWNGNNFQSLLGPGSPLFIW